MSKNRGLAIRLIALRFPSVAVGKYSAKVLCIANAKPCSAPQMIKRKFAPCQSPPNSIVVIWLKWLLTDFFWSFDTKIARTNNAIAPQVMYKGSIVCVRMFIAHARVAPKNRVGKKYPQKVPLRLPPTEKYK